MELAAAGGQCLGDGVQPVAVFATELDAAPAVERVDLVHVVRRALFVVGLIVVLHDGAVVVAGADVFPGAGIVAVGAAGISVTANVAPALCANLHNAWKGGDLKEAARINDRLMPLHEALFVETSPGPVKYAASLLGLCENRLRLPLVAVSSQTEYAHLNCTQAVPMAAMYRRSTTWV